MTMSLPELAAYTALIEETMRRRFGAETAAPFSDTLAHESGLARWRVRPGLTAAANDQVRRWARAELARPAIGLKRQGSL